MNEISIALEWLYSRLTNDATLQGIPIGGVFRGVAPDKTATPYILLIHQGGHDVYQPGANRIMSDLVFQIVAIGPAANWNNIQTAATRIDFLLEAMSGTNADGNILACRRQQPLSSEEIVNGATWTRLGGLYRIWVN
jgi:hypothetical protein